MAQNKKDLRINEQEAPEIRYFNNDTFYSPNFSTIGLAQDIIKIYTHVDRRTLHKKGVDQHG